MDHRTWECPECTFTNQGFRFSCKACGHAAVTAPPPPPAKTSHGWNTNADLKTGRTFYGVEKDHNARTGTHWEKPTRSASAPPGWNAHVDPATGLTFYEHRSSGAVQWEKPTRSASAPPGWNAHVDPATGRTFYEHRSSGAVQWEKPTRSVSAPPGWNAHVDPATGRTFYEHRGSGAVQWEMPATPPPVAAPMGAPPASVLPAFMVRERRGFVNRLLHTIHCEGGSIDGCSVPAAFEQHTGVQWRKAIQLAGIPARRTLTHLTDAMPQDFVLERDGGAGCLRAARRRRKCHKASSGACTWGVACDLQHPVGDVPAYHGAPATGAPRPHTHSGTKLDLDIKLLCDPPETPPVDDVDIIELLKAMGAAAV